MWPTLINKDLEITKVAKFSIALSAYTGALLAIGVILNIALLRHIKQISHNSSIHQTLDPTLTKTIAIILAAQVIAYIPVLIIFNIALYMLSTTTSNDVASKIGKTLLWKTILPQISAVANLLIYFTRNSRMRHYYYRWMQKQRFGKRISPVLRVEGHGQAAS